MQTDVITGTTPTLSASVIDEAIASGRSFAIVLLPGMELPLKFGFDGRSCDDKSFDVIPWLWRFSDRASFRGNSVSNPQSLGNAASMPKKSTPQPEYMQAVGNAVELCRHRSGKIVISRTMCGRFDRKAASVGEIAVNFFSAHPSTLRYIFYTPASGGWLAATPEILVDFDLRNGTLSTMAFAGTRPADCHTEWDAKNTRENQFVVDFITAQLRSLDMTPVVDHPETVAYGDIAHLCRHIHARADRSMLSRVVDALNPTPALCGTPRSEAIKDIAALESHNRGCYGGVVAVASPDRYCAYVNLRCMQFDRDSYCIFGGGGITQDSVPEREYEETLAKTALLRRLTGNAAD